MQRLAAVLALLLVLTMAPPASAQAAPLEDPIPEPIETSKVAVALAPVSGGLTAPNWGTAAPGQPGHLFVVDQPGWLWSIDVATGDKGVVLDVSGLLVPLGVFGPGSFDERGFLGAAFDPHFEHNGYLYTYTSQPADGPADFSTMPAGVEADHQTVITRWQSTDPGDANAPFDQASGFDLLRIDQPQFNHNAGAVAFGPDGMLHIAVGDGGGADDVDGQPFIGGPMVGHGQGNGQDPGNPLGTILRIDPHGTNSANGSYGIPDDNPFVGVDGHLDEILAYGFRNPFRMSFDAKDGRLWVGDVGQNDIEEVDVVFPGGNYGWNLKEGSFFFDPNGPDPGFVTDVDPGVPADLIDPVAEYDHDEGVSVIGGFVYRGDDVRTLRGRYVFGEFSRTFNNDGRLFVLGDGNEIEELQLPLQNGLGRSLLGFGQDGGGELYVLGNLTGTPFGETGSVERIVPATVQKRFTAELSGDQEVPPVFTEASGVARFKVHADGTELRYDLRVRRIEDVVQAHIHLGPAGENGPVVAFLFGPEPDGVDIRNGRLAKGTITAQDLLGPLAGASLEALLVELRTGNAYVNVHTVAVPSGEIRGQIR